MPSFRRAWVVVCWLGLPFALALPSWGQGRDEPTAPGKEKKEEEKPPVIQLPTDARLKKKLAAAGDYINGQSWEGASRILQSLLDTEQDSFVIVPGKDAQGRPTTHEVSVKTEANRLLESLPPRGREHYQLLYGPTAHELFKQATEKKDDELLAQVVSRYGNTPAGLEALPLQAGHAVALGHFARASLLFDQLQVREALSKWSPEAQYAATRAFRRVGDKTRAVATWKELQGRAQQGKLRIGEQTRSVQEWDAELDKAPPPPEMGNDWAVYRGDPARQNRGRGDRPFLEKTWSYPMMREDQTKSLVGQAIKQAESRLQPVLPAFFPVTVGGRVVYRDYWGVHARDARSGRVLWESDSRYSFDRLVNSPPPPAASQNASSWARTYLSVNKPGMFYENSVIGSLSADEDRVYVVEDLYLPPPSIGLVWNVPAKPNYGPLSEAVYVNRLHAFSVRSGKLLWDVYARGDDNREVGEAYFLGPPLPLGEGRLYVLQQKDQELRLLCLDAKRGDVRWSQTLATFATKLSQDSNRRTLAAHPAFSEGILVCPTNTGMVLGVDLIAHGIVWAHTYQEQGAVQPNPLHLQLPRGGLPGMLGGAATSSAWKATAPLVQDGRVIFGAPDGNSIRCLNLRDGSLIWKTNRADDDVYLGGVVKDRVLVVGKKDCRALSLADGSPCWQVTTGLPSGQGIATDSAFYLPLKEGPGHEPEVCVIDIERGRDVAHLKSRKKEIPGNLIFSEGVVISQTVEEIAAYPQLRTRLKHIDEVINRNPSDPVGLAERAELRLSDGDLRGAVVDLQTALKNNPPRGIREKLRAQLFDALTEYLTADFAGAERYLGEYRELCNVDVAEDAMPADKQRAAAEHERRLRNYLALVARGREMQGRLTDALQTYLEFAGLASRRELVNAPDDRAVRAPGDVWAHGRIAAMLTRTTAEQRQTLEQEIRRQWQGIQKEKDLDNLRTFVRLFGDSPVGREARLLLAERLAKEQGFLEAERQLLILRRPADDPKTAARATDALARLCMNQGLLEDALHWYRTLGREFPSVLVRDRKTGADILNDVATDKRFLPYLEEPGQAWTGGKVGFRVEPGNFPSPRQLFNLDPDGEALPCFQRLRVALDSNTNALVLTDRQTQEARGSVKLAKAPSFNYIINQPQVAGGAMPRFTYRTVGHVMVLSLGHMVFGIDLHDDRQTLLWERSLLGPQGMPPGGQTMIDAKDGSVHILHRDGWTQRLGQTGPVEPSAVCLHTHDGLTALDPLTGTTLWTRNDVSPRSQIFGDDRYLYLAEMNKEGNAASTRVFRAADGVAAMDVPDFASVFQQRQRVAGGRILAATTRGRTMHLRLYDIPSGKDLWTKKCPADSLLVHCEDPHLGAVVEPDGSLTAVDMQSAREILKVQVDSKNIEKAQGVALLSDATQYYLVINGPRDPQGKPWGGPMPNFQPASGVRCLPVNGKVYAFDRLGKIKWTTLDIPEQMLVLEQSRELPVLVMTSRYNRIVRNGVNARLINGAALTVLDKRNGKFVLDDREGRLQDASQFHTYRVDLREGKIELTSDKFRATLTLPHR
jgi:outer membrane protein assembly factor BamB